MTTRTRSVTVVFSRPFLLSAVGETQPAGDYVVETDEELIQTLSFPVYRRTATWLRLRPRPGAAGLDRLVNVDPAELDRALACDAAESARCA
jgi:hypothetical protein